MRQINFLASLEYSLISSKRLINKKEKIEKAIQTQMTRVVLVLAPDATPNNHSEEDEMIDITNKKQIS